MRSHGTATALLAAVLVVTWGFCPCALARALAPAGAATTTARVACPCCARCGAKHGPGPCAPRVPKAPDCPKCLQSGCGKTILAGDGPVALPDDLSVAFADAGLPAASVGGAVPSASVLHLPAGPPGLAEQRDTVVLTI